MSVEVRQIVPKRSATTRKLLAVLHVRFAMTSIAVFGCSSHDLRKDTGNSALAGDAGATDGAARVPVDHRAAATACTEARGPGSVTGTANCPDIPATCAQDSDCTAGKNGRCFSGTHGCTMVGCSYDGCSSDSDCADGEACGCRMSAMDSSPTVCVTAECRTDADCGRGGYCSPSLVGDSCMYPSEALCTFGGDSCSPGPCLCGDSRGHGYFCHTANDTCLDNGDCDTSSGSSCGYDRLEKRWTCTGIRICPT